MLRKINHYFLLDETLEEDARISFSDYAWSYGSFLLVVAMCLYVAIQIY